MTKDQLKKYLDGVIDDIRTLYVKTQEKLQEIQKKASSEWTTVYSVPVHMTPEQQAAFPLFTRHIKKSCLNCLKSGRNRAISSSSGKEIQSMKKSTPNMQILLQETEKHLREHAELIIKAKEIGISQQSIDKMIDCISISKAYYYDMKRRFKKNGK